MKDIFSNWRRWRSIIKESEEPTGFRKLLTQEPIENHPKLGPLPPAPEDITEDHYVEAIVAVAKCIKNGEARERYLDAAYGRTPIYDFDDKFLPRTGHKMIKDVNQLALLKSKIKMSVKYSYYVGGFFTPCEIAGLIEQEFQKEKKEYESKIGSDFGDDCDGAPCSSYKAQEGDTLKKIAKRVKAKPKDLIRWNSLKEPYSIEVGDIILYKARRKKKKPTDDEFSELGLIKFKGNSAVFTKGNDYREGRTWGWPTMIRFLDSFTQNPSLKRWGPWYVEDISRQEGGDITEHGSHEWGLDVDISIPTTTLRGAPWGFEPGGKDLEKKTYQNISQGTSPQDLESGHWGFQDVLPEELNLDACIDLLEHCFSGKYQTGWKVKNIWVDDILITAIKNELEKRAKEGKFPKEYLALFGKQRRHKKWPKEKKWMGGPVSHWPAHQNHFHIRLVGIDPEVKRAIRKGGTQKQGMAYLTTREVWDKIINNIQKAHDLASAKKAADEETMEEI